MDKAPDLPKAQPRKAQEHGRTYTFKSPPLRTPDHSDILDPVMKLDVFALEEKVGDVIGDLNRRRGVIQGQETSPGGIRVKAEAPLSAMFGYIGDLRTMTSGRGQFSMEFSHYAPCPKNVSDDVISKAKAKEEALRAAK